MTTYLHLVLGLRVSGALSPLHGVYQDNFVCSVNINVLIVCSVSMLPHKSLAYFLSSKVEQVGLCIYYSSSSMVDTNLLSRHNISTTYFLHFIPLRMVIDHIKIQNSCWGNVFVGCTINIMPKQAFYLAVTLVVVTTHPQVFQKSTNYL
jgi:hypothetical protein